MCRLIKYERDVVPENITVHFERDASMRATEVTIINTGNKGEYGITAICLDSGIIVNGHELKDGVDLVSGY